MVFSEHWHQFSPTVIAHQVEPLRLWVKGFGGWAPAIFVGLFVLRPLALIPSTLVIMLGGALFGLIPGTVLGITGAMLSGAVEFGFIRHVASLKIKDFIRQKAPAVVRVTEKKGFLTVFLIRLVPNVAFDLQNGALALTSVRFSDFCWGTLAGCFPAILFYVFLGDRAFLFIKSVQ